VLLLFLSIFRRIFLFLWLFVQVGGSSRV